MLPLPEIDGTFQEEEDNDNLSEEQLRIKNFLKEKEIVYLVHFTDESRIKSIIENGICSPKEGERRGIKFNVNNDKDMSANKANKYMKSTSDDYISLTITSINEKVLSAYKAACKIKNAKQILIDARILWKEMDKDRIYCNMNASAGSLNCGNDFNALESMFAPTVMQTKFNGEQVIETRNGKPINVPTHKQAEILFQSHIDQKYFMNKSELFDEYKNLEEECSPIDDLPF